MKAQNIYFVSKGQEWLLPVGAEKMPNQPVGWWMGEDIPNLPFGQTRIVVSILDDWTGKSSPELRPVEVVVLHRVADEVPILPALWANDPNYYSAVWEGYFYPTPPVWWGICPLCGSANPYLCKEGGDRPCDECGGVASNQLTAELADDVFIGK